ncbi:Adenylate cyclase type 10 [Phlyctochytrium planicorne]|nr:Adenylate cyclase type 10 [Phlyctochytrium planicorne]
MQQLQGGWGDGNLAPFVARHVRELIADPVRREKLKAAISDGQPFVESEEMAVVIVDISGYSALTTLLNEKVGKISSEAISESVNAYLNAVSEIIISHGGDIVKFLGDALLVKFVAIQNEDLVSISQRSFWCCVEILSKCSSYEVDLKRWTDALNLVQRASTTSGGKHQDIVLLGSDYSSNAKQQKDKARLRLHLAVTTGTVSHIVIGTLRRRLDYHIDGECLASLGNLLDNAKAGELAVSDSVVEILALPQSSLQFRRAKYAVIPEERLREFADRFKLQARHKPMSSLPDTKLDENLLHMFINQSVCYRAGSQMLAAQVPNDKSKNSIGSFGEYRTISVLFVKFLTNHSPSETQTILSTFLESISKYDGVFQQCAVDDKGKTFLACFGLPPFLHERTGLFAVQAALHFVSAIGTAAKGRLSIALGSGEILFTIIGTLQRREAGLLGDVFNLAARLLNISQDKGCIAFDDKTAADVSAIPYSVVRLLIQKLQSFARTKTKRKESFSEFPKSTLLLAPQKLIRADKSIDDVRDLDRVLSFLDAVIESWAENEGGGGAAGKSKTHLDVERAKFELSLARLMALMMSQFKIVLLLDDVQWIDRVSLEVICSGIRSAADLFVGAFSRPLSEDNTFFSLSLTKRMQLTGMKREEIKRYLDDTFGATLQHNEIIEIIIAKTGGNPLQIDNVVSIAVERLKAENYSSAADRENVLQQTLSSLFSCKLETVIMTKFEKLNAKFQNLLRHASIFGQYIKVEELVELLGEDPVVVNQLLLQIPAEFLELEDTTVFFKHITIANAVYESISISERQRLHRKLAQNLLSLFKKR